VILPKEIKTRQKIRDAKIINTWNEGVTQKELGKIFGICPQAIYSIIRKNRELLKIDKEAESVFRLHDLKNQMRKMGPTEKDRLDVIEAMRKETEGNPVTNIVTQFLQVESTSSKPNRLNEIQSQLIPVLPKPQLEIPANEI